MLTRIIIRLRLPVAMMAVFFTAVMVASSWFYATGSVLIAPLRTHVGVEISIQGIVIAWGNLDPFLVSGIRVSVAPAWMQWTWWPRLDRFVYSPSVDFVAIPHWAIVVPTVVLAFAGYRARRTRLVGGHCRHCDYLMGPSSNCPECGRAKPSN